MTTVPAPSHEANRLTEGDRARVTAAVQGACAEWRGAGGTPKLKDVDTLARLGANSIGLQHHELRDSELAWIEDQCREAIGGRP